MSLTQQASGASFEGVDRAPLFSCTIPGDPRGKGSVRVLNGHGVKDEKTAEYMGRCILFMRQNHQGGSITGCLAMTMDVYLRRPEKLVPRVGPRIRTPQPPPHAFPAPCLPDVDNVSKAICDALTQAGVIEDDKLIVCAVIHKWYAAVGDSPRVEVTLSRIPGGWP